ncbi:MAG: hypothetical protein HW384_553 [Dehalococcoidia bacterium]|nr:hypothetical protein [Dehalococcoidia bacterium]
MKIMFKQSKGFTLIELMVVMTILSVLAGIVVPAVTGTTTAGRGTTMTADVNTVQNAVERFVGDHPKGNNGGWPTHNGVVPSTGSVPIVWGASFVDKTDGISVRTFAPFTLAQAASPNTPVPAAIAGASSTYIRTALPHAAATRGDLTQVDGKYTGTLIDGSQVITVTASGSKPNMTVATTYADTNTTGWTITDDIAAPTFYPVWRVDSTGKVFVALNAYEY